MLIWYVDHPSSSSQNVEEFTIFLLTDFQPAIDLEMRYRGGENVDIGVFAPAENLSAVEAERLIESIVSLSHHV